MELAFFRRGCVLRTSPASTMAISTHLERRGHFSAGPFLLHRIPPIVCSAHAMGACRSLATGSVVVDARAQLVSEDSRASRRPRARHLLHLARDYPRSMTIWIRSSHDLAIQFDPCGTFCVGISRRAQQSRLWTRRDCCSRTKEGLHDILFTYRYARRYVDVPQAREEVLPTNG
jgi:hypothetical protein